MNFSTGSVGKNLPASQKTKETWVRSLGREDRLEKEMATHSSILAWRIPWTEELGGLQSTSRKESDTTEQLHFHWVRRPDNQEGQGQEEEGYLSWSIQIEVIQPSSACWFFSGLQWVGCCPPALVRGILFNLLIWMSISSRNTLTDTPRNNALPAIRESLNSVKLTLKTNNHNWPSIEGLSSFNCVFCGGEKIP